MEKTKNEKSRTKTRQTYAKETLKGIRVEWALSPNARARANNVKNIAKLIRKANIGLGDLINSELMRHYTINAIKDYYYTAQDMILAPNQKGNVNHE